MSKKIEIDHPGIILKKRYLDELGITPYRIAKDTGISPVTMNSICNGKSAIAPKNALKIARYLGLSREFWANMQSHYDLRMAEAEIENELEAIQQIAS